MSEEQRRRRAAARRRKEQARRQRNRRIAIAVGLMLVIVLASVGGTVAWLMDSTQAITNTFSPSNIGLKLEETYNAGGSQDKANDKWELKMIPGVKAQKDPKVTITTDIEAYLFVVVDESWSMTVGTTTYTLGDFISYNLEMTGWTKGTASAEGGNGVPTNVYYRTIDATAEGWNGSQSWYLLKGEGEGDYKNGVVTVNSTVTKEMMTALGTDSTNYPKLSFKAYAIQKEGFETPATAWTEASKDNN